MRKIEKNELCLLIGRWTSLIGNLIFDYANSVSIVSMFNDKPFVLGFYQGSESIVNVVLNLFGGVAADGKNKKSLLVLTDLLSFLICFTVSFFVKGDVVAIALIVANLILAVVSSFNSPTYSSILRSVVRKERIIQYNSVIHTGTGIIKIGIPLVAVSLVNVIGPRGSLLVDAGTFLVSAIAEMLLKPFEDGDRFKQKKANIYHQIAEGIHYILKQHNLLLLILLSASVNLFLAGYNLLLPYTDVMFKKQYAGFYGKALAMQAVGGIISSWINAHRKKKEASIGEMILFLALTGVPLILAPVLAYIDNIIVNLLPYIIFGAFLTLYNIQFMSYVQLTTDGDYLGRVFSVIFSVAVLFMPLGSFIFSAMLNVNDVRMFYLIGIGIVLLSVISMLNVKKEER